MSDLIDREAAIELAEAYLHSEPKADELDHLSNLARYSNSTVRRITAALRTLPSTEEVVVAEGTVSKRVSGDDAIELDHDEYGESRGVMYVDPTPFAHHERVQVVVRKVKGE